MSLAARHCGSGRAGAPSAVGIGEVDSTVERPVWGDDDADRVDEADDVDGTPDRVVAAPGPEVVTAGVTLDGGTAVSVAAEGEPADEVAGVLGVAGDELVHPPVRAIADTSAVAAAIRAARWRKRNTAPR